VGQGNAQEALTIHLCIPPSKPSAQQIIDVFVKKLRITHVQVTTDCVIVRGDFELKSIYVACRPSQPVHAVEVRCVRFIAHVPICGARCTMEADASVIVEYVDYECDYHTRKDQAVFSARKSKHIHCGQPEYYQEHPKHKGCFSYEDEDISNCCCPPHHKRCVRKFEAVVVLCITAKVVVGREILIQPQPSYTPKG
jgi:hypothetical protein